MATWNIHVGLAAWTNHTFALGDDCSNGGNAYRCITAGTSTSAPTGTGTDIAPGGTAHFKWLSAIDYTALQSWADDNSDSLTADALVQIWNHGVIQCVPAGGDPLLYIAAPSVPNSWKITIKPAPGEGIFEKSGIPLAYDATNGVAIQLPTGTDTDDTYVFCEANNLTFEGIQFKNPRQGGLSVPLACVGNNVTVRKCIFDVYGRESVKNIELVGSGALIDTCLFLDRHTTSPQNLAGFGTGSGKIINSLFVATAAPGVNQAVYIDDVTNTGRVIRNSGIFGWAASEPIWSGAPSIIAADHCITDGPNFGDRTIDGGNNLTSKVLANQIRSTTTDFRLKFGADAIGAGVADTDSPQGFFGTVRGTSVDIGPDEFAPTSPAVTGAAVTASAHAPTVFSSGLSRSVTGASAVASVHAVTFAATQRPSVVGAAVTASPHAVTVTQNVAGIRGGARARGRANPTWFIVVLQAGAFSTAGVVGRPRGKAAISAYLSGGAYSQDFSDDFDNISASGLHGRAFALSKGGGVGIPLLSSVREFTGEFTNEFTTAGPTLQSARSSVPARGRVAPEIIATVRATGRASPRSTTPVQSVIAIVGRAIIRARSGGTARTVAGLRGAIRASGIASRTFTAPVVLRGSPGRPRGRIQPSMHIPVAARGRAVAAGHAVDPALLLQPPVQGAPAPLTIWQRLASVTPTHEMHIKPRLMRMSFGDGYGQTVPDGMTFVVRQMTLTWTNITVVECDQIIQFFRNQLGVPISFVAPRETAPRKWLVMDWRRTSPEPDGETIAVTFEDRPFYEPVLGL